MTDLHLTVTPGPGIAASHGRAYLFISEAADQAAEQLLKAWQTTNDVDALFTVVRSRRPVAVTPFCAVLVDAAGVHVAIHGRLGLVASVNGAAKITASDSSASAIAGAGTAGMWTDLAGVIFDDFTVTTAGSR